MAGSLLIFSIGLLAMIAWVWWYGRPPLGSDPIREVPEDYLVLLDGGEPRVLEYWWAQLIEHRYLVRQADSADPLTDLWIKSSARCPSDRYWLARAWLEVDRPQTCPEILAAWSDVVHDLENHLIDDGWLEPVDPGCMVKASAFPIAATVLLFGATQADELWITLPVMALLLLSAVLLLISPPSSRQSITRRAKVLRKGWLGMMDWRTGGLVASTAARGGAAALRGTPLAAFALPHGAYQGNRQAYRYEGGGALRLMGAWWLRRTVRRQSALGVSTVRGPSEETE